MLAVQAHDTSVETIEGLSDGGEIADLQAVFRDRNALQCGYCTPGMLMAAQDFLRQSPNPIVNNLRIFRQLLSLYRLSGHCDACRNHSASAHGALRMTKSARPDALSVLDRPNSYIGKTVPRPNLDRLLQGRGLYVSDMEMPRMAHVVFVRSPHAHAKIRNIEVSTARRQSGVIAVITGRELAAVITPWVGVLSHLKGLKTAKQNAIATERVCWQGEAVAAVVATSRAAAEDAAEHVAVEYGELEAVTDMRTALDPATPVIHASLGDNLAFERTHNAGEVDRAANDEVIGRVHFGAGPRHAEPRAGG
jgi:hypothetical protein